VTVAHAIAPAASRTCVHCAYFSSTPALIESQIPGLRTLGSAYASVCADDGICARHARYISGAASCEEFALAGYSAA
jgi:hypothetical protein